MVAAPAAPASGRLVRRGAASRSPRGNPPACWGRSQNARAQGKKPCVAAAGTCAQAGMPCAQGVATRTQAVEPCARSAPACAQASGGSRASLSGACASPRGLRAGKRGLRASLRSLRCARPRACPRCRAPPRGLAEASGASRRPLWSGRLRPPGMSRLIHPGYAWRRRHRAASACQGCLPAGSRLPDEHARPIWSE